MVISLGQDPWILISLTFLELLFLLIPPLIAAKIEQTSMKEQLEFMGIQKPTNGLLRNLLEGFFGICMGMALYLVGGYISLFYKLIIVILLGAEFLQSAEGGAISTQPLKPSIIQLIIIVLLQFFVVALSEEAFFRGFLIKKLQYKFRTGLSVIISSILFALYHTPPFIVPISTIISFFGFYFTFGILLSLLFIGFNQSLIPVIMSHAIYNILVFLF